MSLGQPNASKLTFRDMTENDAISLCDCVRRCYGETYFVQDFYNPDKLASLVREGLIHSRVAVTPAGEVVGHLGIRMDRDNDITADGIAAMVAPRYRGHRILIELGMQLANTYERLNLIGLQLYAIAMHPIVQEHSTEAGGVETGILLGHFPSEVEMEGFTSDYAGSRIAAVMLYFPLRPAPQRTVYLPERYREIITSIYQQLNLPRSIRDGALHDLSKATMARIDKKPRQGTIEIRVKRLGSDLSDTITNVKKVSPEDTFPVLYVDIPLNDPASALLAERIRSLGFFYGGIIVERSGSDILRMQSVSRENVNPDAIVLARQHGNRLLKFILSDWQDEE